MSSIQEVYRKILMFCLYRIKNEVVYGESDMELIKIELEHIHELPNAMLHTDRRGHRHYLHVQIPSYLEKMKFRKLSEYDEMHLERLETLWAELRGAVDSLPEGD